MIFDLDGTLADARPGVLASYRAALTALGHKVTPREEAAFAIGPPMMEAWARLLAPLGDTRVTEGVRLYRAHYATEGRHLNALFDGIPEALDQLAGVRLVIATAKPREVGAAIAISLGLMRWTDTVYGSVPDGTLDRKEALFEHILAHENLDPARTLIVGDWRYDMSAARTLGLRRFGAGWGYDTVDALTAAGAETVIPSPADLAPAVLRWRRALPSPPLLLR